MTKPPLISCEQVDVVLSGQTILRDINWRLYPGEHWAILGGNGSGKSTLLKLVRGELWPAPGPGKRVYAFDGAAQTSAVGVKEKIGLVSPELQERYLSQDWLLTGLQVIQTGFLNTDYLYDKPAPPQNARAASISRLLGLDHLLASNVQHLSTGELRKILIARALAGDPRILILDEVCDGLDARSRAQLLQMVERVARSGTQILYTTHRADETLPVITHELMLEKGRIVRSGKRTNASVPPEISRLPAKHKSANPSSGHTSAAILRRNNISEAIDPVKTRGQKTIPPAQTLIYIQGVNVFLERKRVLQDIHWRFTTDQHWAIFGQNGAGKSTLLKLIFGDLHAAAGGTIRRFDLKAHNTIWDLKGKIGYVSPTFQANYREELTGADVIASGFFSSVGLIDKVTSSQRRKVEQLLEIFALGPLARKELLQMSYGEVRAILTLRALVNAPQILILDEPFDGLDAKAKADFANTLERVSRNGARLIIVTHHPGDLPPCITHGLLLEQGRIRCQGEMERLRHHPAMLPLFHSATG